MLEEEEQGEGSLGGGPWQGTHGLLRAGRFWRLMSMVAMLGWQSRSRAQEPGFGVIVSRILNGHHLSFVRRQSFGRFRFRQGFSLMAFSRFQNLRGAPVGQGWLLGCDLPQQ